MNDLILNEVKTMSSREIAELCETTHDSVLKTIRGLVDRGIVSGNDTLFFYKHPQNGQLYPEFRLNYRDSMVVTSGYSVELRAKIIDRWQELEGQQQFKSPTTLSGALRLAAEQAETIEAQQALIEQQRPAVEFVDRYVEARSSKCLSDVAKLLKHKPRAFIKLLADAEVIFKRGGSWVPYQKHIDAGRFTVTTGEGNGHAYQQTRVEPDGIVWLAKTFPSIEA